MRRALVVRTPAHQALPATLSPSRAKDFDGCELRYYFGGVERWRSPPTEHTLLGNVVHAAIEALYRTAPFERTRAQASHHVGVAWADARQDGVNETLLSDETLRSTLELRAEAALDGLFHLEHPPSVVVDAADIESWTAAELFGAPVRGRIDRSTRTPLWRVTDYKTGKVPAGQYVEGALAGLFTYAATLAASHHARRLPDEVELLYLLAPQRIRRPVLRPYLLKHARRVGDTWAAIVRANSDGVWVARTSPLCGWCPFAVACVAVTKSAPTTGSPESHAVLAATGLRRGGEPLPVDDADRDPDRDEAEVRASTAEGASA